MSLADRLLTVPRGRPRISWVDSLPNEDLKAELHKIRANWRDGRYVGLSIKQIYDYTEADFGSLPIKPQALAAWLKEPEPEN